MMNLSKHAYYKKMCSSLLRDCVTTRQKEIASALTLLAMTENPLNAVIASDRRERGNLVFRVKTQSPRKGKISWGIIGLMILMGLLPATYPCQAGLISGARVLTYPASARALGLGDAYTAMADDLDAIYFNPAGLQRMSKPQISATYFKTLEDTFYTTLAFGMPATASSAWGGSVAYFDAGRLDYITGDGSEKSVKAMQDCVVTLSGSLCLYAGNCAGLNVKFLSSRLAESYSGFTAALDGGVSYHVWRDLQFGLAIKNLGPKLKYGQAGDLLPSSLQAGLAYRWSWVGKHVLACSAESVKPLDQDFKFHTGVEYGFNKMLFARAGYKAGYDLAGFTAGCGAALGGVQMDYAFAGMGAFGLNHLVTLSVKF
jgi:hypothetical protein